MNRSDARVAHRSSNQAAKKNRRGRSPSARLALASAAIHERLECRQLLSGTPAVTIAGAPNTSEGADYQLSLSSSNLGSLTIDHWTIDWGDGQSTVPGSASEADHFYADGPNTYNIDASATLSDNSVVQANQGSSTVVSDGSLDSSFGTGGKVISSFGGTSGPSTSIALLDDGQFAVLGTTTTGTQLVRYNADGSLDNSFNNNTGVVNITAGANTTVVATTVLDENVPDPSNPGHTVEKILVAGNADNFSADSFRSTLWRFNADGTVDTTFGSSGVVTLPPAVTGFAQPGDNIADAIIDPDGQIVTVGVGWGGPAFESNGQFLTVARINATDGSLDTTFNGTGEQAQPIGTSANFGHFGNSVTVTPFSVVSGADESVVALAYSANPSTFQPQLMKFTPTGALDTSFGGTGVVSVGPTNAIFEAATLDSAGNILLAGQIQGNPAFFGVERVSYSTGAPDASFGATDTQNNFSTFPGLEETFVSHTGGNIAAIATTATGQIVVTGAVQSDGGLTPITGNSDEAVVRYNSNGNLDTSFGSHGISLIDFQGGSDTPVGLAIQPDSRIVVAGFSDTGPRTNDSWTLARLGQVASSSSTPVTVNVANVAPTATILGAPTSPIAEGSSVSLSSTVTDPGTLDTAAGFAYQWTATKNGVQIANGGGPGDANFGFTTDDNATYVVTLTATDKDGGVSIPATATFTTFNVPPTPSITAPVSTGNEGTAITLHGSATDPSSVDTAAGLALSWSVTKNGSAFGATGSGASYTFTPDDNGTYVVTLKATDKDNGVGTTTDTINVANVAPTPTIASPVTTGTEGTAITLTGSATDPSTVDTAAGLALSWSVTKNGSAFGTTGSGPSYTFTPNDNGTYVVTLKATDKDNGVGTTTDTINVSNVAPTVSAITAPAKDVRYQTANFSASFTDPGALDTHTVTWNFGDGSTPTSSSLAAGVTGAVNSSHVYTVAGTYTVTLTVTDKDGGSGVSTKSFTVDIADIQTDPVNPAHTALFVGGTSGDDVITVTNGSHSSVQVQINSTTLTGFTPTGRIVVYGGDGNDVIQVANGIALPDEIYGGNGNDLLKGGNGGSNILVGGPGDDLLDGGGQRDLLFGGGGNDALVGGSSNDLLVAMVTQWDNNPTALEAIQSEWLRTDVSFSAQVTHLTQGGGLNGSYILNGSTTTNDNAADLLIGNSGNDLFVVSNGDIILDDTNKDTVVDLTWVTV